MHASVILNRQNITSEPEKLLIVKLNYHTQGIYMFLSQAITAAKARPPFKALKNRDSETSCEDSLRVAPTALETDWVAKLSGSRFTEDVKGQWLNIQLRDRRP